MKWLVSILWVVSVTSVDAQRIVRGIVKDELNEVLIGVLVKEVGTENKTWTDVNGQYYLQTTEDTCQLVFLSIGSFNNRFTLTKSQILNVKMSSGHSPPRRISLGTNYDFVNHQIGFSLSNGYDEKPLIHFEDFKAKWAYKILASSNFQRDYGFSANLAYNLWGNPFFPTIEVIRQDYLVNNFKRVEANFSFGIGAQFLPLDLIFKPGVQSLNEDCNFGLAIGTDQIYLTKRAYSEFSFGYWGNYFSYKGVLHGVILEEQLSFRVLYERVNNFDFLRLGLNYLFVE